MQHDCQKATLYSKLMVNGITNTALRLAKPVFCSTPQSSSTSHVVHSSPLAQSQQIYTRLDCMLLKAPFAKLPSSATYYFMFDIRRHSNFPP